MKWGEKTHQTIRHGLALKEPLPAVSLFKSGPFLSFSLFLSLSLSFSLFLSLSLSLSFPLLPNLIFFFDFFDFFDFFFCCLWYTRTHTHTHTSTPTRRRRRHHERNDAAAILFGHWRFVTASGGPLNARHFIPLSKFNIETSMYISMEIK